MSYSQLVLSSRPSGYWEYPTLGINNLLTQNQYSLETNTSGWSAVNGTTTISRTTSSAYIGSASLSATANATASDSIAIRISSGNRIQVYPGRKYTMIARVKRGTGSRNAAIRVEYYTTQSGSTLSEAVRTGSSFTLSNSEWTTIYLTDLIFTPNDNNYYASWGVVSTNSGSIGDTLLIDAIQFYEGDLYGLEDRVSSNNINIIESRHESVKPIIFGTNGSAKLFDDSYMILENNYKLFVSGSENKAASIDFWFSLEKPPSYRHTLLQIGTFLTCYVQRDRIYIESEDKTSSIQVTDWDSQHYVAICYSDRKIDLYLDDRLPASVTLNEDFRFSDTSTLVDGPSIVFGPSSKSNNLIINPSFNSNQNNWTTTGTGTTFSILTSDSFSASQCLQITKTNNINCGALTSNLSSVEPYKKYYASVYVKIPTGQETSTIRLYCKKYNSSYDGALLGTVETTSSVSVADGWKRISLSFTPDIYTKYVSFGVDQPTAGTNGKVFLVDSATLEKSEYLTSWNHDSENSDPLFISSIGIYPFVLSNRQMTNRINYATNDVSDELAIRYRGDRINPFYNSVYSTKELDMSDLSTINNFSLKNFVPTSNGLEIKKIKPATIQYGLLGGSYDLTSEGIKFIDDCYAVMSDVVDYMNTVSSTIRLQYSLSNTSGDAIILAITPLVGYYAFLLKKESNQIKGILLKDYDDSSPVELFSTSTLSSADYDIALNFTDKFISCVIGATTFTNIDFPSIGNPPQIYLGNLPGFGIGCQDRIRNFSIDDLTDFIDIDWYNPGNFMLRFNGNLNISQIASLSYVGSELATSNNTIISFNNASQPTFIVNDEYIVENQYIPSFNYADPQPVSINAYVVTEDSLNDSPKINNLHLSSYNSNYITSSLSNFQLVPNIDGSSNIISNPYIIKSIDNNILSHDSNIGIMFKRGQSSGCRIVKASADYSCFEFVFKINTQPNTNETYNIFDLSGATSINLSYSINGLIKSGTYDIYIDGIQVNDVSQIDILTGEFYHLFIVFSDAKSSDLHLGSNKLQQNTMNGSIGKICMYETIPANISSYISSKYSDLIGRITRSVSGGSLSVSDDSGVSQTYYRDTDGHYYEMISLPKVKFVISSWEEIDLTN